MKTADQVRRQMRSPAHDRAVDEFIRQVGTQIDGCRAKGDKRLVAKIHVGGMYGMTQFDMQTRVGNNLIALGYRVYNHPETPVYLCVELPVAHETPLLQTSAPVEPNTLTPAVQRTLQTSAAMAMQRHRTLANPGPLVISAAPGHSMTLPIAPPGQLPTMTLGGGPPSLAQLGLREPPKSSKATTAVPPH